jgi:hypothetical protein
MRDGLWAAQHRLGLHLKLSANLWRSAAPNRQNKIVTITAGRSGIGKQNDSSALTAHQL